MKDNDWKPGKMHRWWLRQFGESRTHGIDIDGYAGTAYGRALSTCVKRGLIRRSIDFESMGIFEITDSGIEALKT